MQVKMLEIRDRFTFMPVMCIKPVGDNDAQRWLLMRDGWGEETHCVIVIDTHRNRAIYDPHGHGSGARTLPVAHYYIETHWNELKDGDVVDVEFILCETPDKKISERYEVDDAEKEA